MDFLKQIAEEIPEGVFQGFPKQISEGFLEQITEQRPQGIA